MKIDRFGYRLFVKMLPQPGVGQRYDMPVWWSGPEGQMLRIGRLTIIFGKRPRREGQ